MIQDIVVDYAMDAANIGNLEKMKDIVSSIPKDNVSDLLSRCHKTGWTPLNVTIIRSDVQFAFYLLEDCHVDPMMTNNFEFEYPLTKAAYHGTLKIVEKLIESGAKLNLFEEKDYSSPLKTACRNGYELIARLLIDKGEDIDKSKCLIAAFHSPNNALIKYILECGADVNVKDKNGKTPLHACCVKGNIEILKILVDKGVNHRSEFMGSTPIQWAGLKGRENVISFYYGKNHCTQDEVLDSFELLGVSSVLRGDIPSAIQFWNKELWERSSCEKATFKSSFFEKFQINPQEISNYDYLNDNLEKSAIHSIIIIERIIGIEKPQFENYLEALSELISITNFDFWEAILVLSIKISPNFIANETIHHFIIKFRNYSQKLNFKNLNTSILKLIYRVLNSTLKIEHLKLDKSKVFTIYFYCTICILCLCQIKEHLQNFDNAWFHSIIKDFLNFTKFSNESPFHILIRNFSFWRFEDEMVYETFELLCKLSETTDDLNNKNETPLHSVLKIFKHSRLTDILLKYGAAIDTRDIKGQSIKQLAMKRGREDICIGPSSLQTLINVKGSWYNFVKFLHLPAIMKHYIKFH